MHRRDFLFHGIRTAAGVILSVGYRSAQVTPARRKVIVVGAGLAGLVTAYELDSLGYDVTVLEAQGRRRRAGNDRS